MLAAVTAAVTAAVIAAASHGMTPDPRVTPGAVNPSLTAEQICSSTFSTKHYRHSTKEIRARVYSEYHFTQEDDPCPCTIDHLIPLEIGGASTIANMWPQPVEEAEAKDWLEDKLHDLVCSGQISLQEAQTAIATDWVSAFKKYHVGRQEHRK